MHVNLITAIGWSASFIGTVIAVFAVIKGMKDIRKRNIVISSISIGFIIIAISIYIIIGAPKNNNTLPTIAEETTTQTKEETTTQTKEETTTQTKEETTIPSTTEVQKITDVESTTEPEIVKADFSDNFDGGANNSWESLSGTWRVINGEYTADPTDESIAYSMVGDLGWRDYMVDVDISVLCQGGYPIILLIRSLDTGNGMQMHIDCCNTKWLLYKNGTGNVIAEFEKGIPYECGTDVWTTSHIQIKVQGNQYAMFLNGAGILQVQDDTYSYGRSGVGIECPFGCARFDNFKISSIQ